MRPPRIVVYPPTTGGGRRVRVGSTILGRARSLPELLLMLRQAGIDADLLDIRSNLFEWRGGGPGVWG